MTRETSEREGLWMDENSNDRLDIDIEAGEVRPKRREQLFELLVFLFLILPSMVISFFMVRQGYAGFVLTAVATIVRDLSLVSLIFFFIWRNGEAPSRLGWTRRNFWGEVWLGAVLFIPFTLGTGLLVRALESAGLSAPSTPLPSYLAARGIGEFVLAGILVAIVAVTEETIFRGYMILRFRTVTANLFAAAVISSVIFSIGHGYEGAAGILTVGVMGFIFALVYIWRRSLTAPMVMHFLQDFIGIVLMPLLGIR